MFFPAYYTLWLLQFIDLKIMLAIQHSTLYVFREHISLLWSQYSYWQVPLCIIPFDSFPCFTERLLIMVSRHSMLWTIMPCVAISKSAVLWQQITRSVDLYSCEEKMSVCYKCLYKSSLSMHAVSVLCFSGDCVIQSCCKCSARYGQAQWYNDTLPCIRVQAACLCWLTIGSTVVSVR